MLNENGLSTSLIRSERIDYRLSLVQITCDRLRHRPPNNHRFESADFLFEVSEAAGSLSYRGDLLWVCRGAEAGSAAISDKRSEQHQGLNPTSVGCGVGVLREEVKLGFDLCCCRLYREKRQGIVTRIKDSECSPAFGGGCFQAPPKERVVCFDGNELELIPLLHEIDRVGLCGQVESENHCINRKSA